MVLTEALLGTVLTEALLGTILTESPPPHPKFFFSGDTTQSVGGLGMTADRQVL